MSATTLARDRSCSCVFALLVVAIAVDARAQTLAPAVPAAPAAPAAPARGGFWIAAGGAFQDSHEAFGTRFTFARYFETAVMDGEYETRGGPLADVSAGMPLRWGLGVQGGSSVFTKSHRGVLRGSIPHPLYFAQPRQAELEIPDLVHREIALRAELAWTRALWSNWQISFSGGPAAIHVRQTVFADAEPTETSYPFDTVNVSAATADLSGWGIGGTAAVDVTWFVRRRLGVGVTGRFTRATVGLERVKLSAGGPSAIAGVRFLVH